MSCWPTCTPSQPQLGGEVGAVVEDEGDVAGLRDRPQHVAGAPDRVVVRVLQPQLHAGDVAGVERRRQHQRKRRRVEARRRDQIEPAGRLRRHSAALATAP